MWKDMCTNAQRTATGMEMYVADFVRQQDVLIDAWTDQKLVGTA